MPRPQRNSDHQTRDRDRRMIDWWGLALVASGILALAIAVASFSPD